MRTTTTGLLLLLATVFGESVVVENWKQSLLAGPGRVVVVTDVCTEGELGEPVALYLIDVPPGENELLQASRPQAGRRSCVAPAE